MCLCLFQGFMNTRITYDEDDGAWKMTSMFNNVNGSATAPLGPMGTGEQTWQFSHDLCDINANPPKELKMTVCSMDEFTCARVKWSRVVHNIL